ncbi:MAG: hypothetical protein F6K42_13265 [Leptolyngbya sp. SIO1D8]|nr:hypothetical protein [Leptolyngbya sp. SIO1D8]
MSRYRSFLLSWLSGLLIVGVVGFLGPAIANMASPDYAGDFLGEPWGNVANLDILAETLEFDLRPLEEKQPADIKATYQVNNPGADTVVDLLFVAPGLETGQVILDDSQAISAVITEAPAIPADWQLPQSISPVQGLQFTLPLSSGDHTIAVQYSAEPSGDGLGLYFTYTLDYLLAPAAQWKSFGKLTVDVHAPSDWGTDFSLDLSPVAPGHWQAEFTGLPADILTLSSYPVVPLPVKWLRMILGVCSWVLAMRGVWWLGRWLGKLSQQQQWQQGWLVLAVLLWVPISILLFWGVLGLSSWAAETLLDSRHLGVSYVYSRNILYFFMGLVAAAIAPIAGIVGFTKGRRKFQVKAP